MRDIPFTSLSLRKFGRPLAGSEDCGFIEDYFPNAPLAYDAVRAYGDRSSSGIAWGRQHEDSHNRRCPQVGGRLSSLDPVSRFMP